MPLRVPLLLTEKGIEVVALLHCPSKRIAQSFNFLVDTGSELSMLAWQDAAKVGIDAEELPNYPTKLGGFGGAAEAKHFKEPCFVYLTTDDGELITVELPDGILVWRPSRKKSERIAPSPAISILAREFMARSGCTLVVNMAKKQYYFEA